MSEWISIEEALPATHTLVVIAYRVFRRGELVYERTLATRERDMFREYGKWEIFTNRYTPSFEVPKKYWAGNATHWQYLPESPNARDKVRD